MKKILIVSYFFPPCNLTASQRAFSWASELNKFGFYPTVITRRWDNKINTLKDMSFATGPEIIHQRENGYEVFYLPYKPNLRDRIYTKFGETNWIEARRFLTLIELLLHNFTSRVIPFSNLFDFTKNYLAENRDIHEVVITGNPFILFKLGFQLRKRFGIKWVADYRDAWTTSQITHLDKGRLFKWLYVLDRFFEKKWVGTSSRITASSQPIASRISKLVHVQGEPLFNGFVQEDFNLVKNTEPYSAFTITYVGTLYEGQRIDIFCDAFKELIHFSQRGKIKLLFPGIAFFPEQKARIEKLLTGYEVFFECTERLPREDILEIEKRSHLLLHVAWQGYEGIIASKIYEYIASGTHFLVTPSDNGSIAEITKKSSCGTVTNTVEETFEFLKQVYEIYLSGEKMVNELDNPNVLQFSRKFQAKKLAAILKNI